MAAAGDVARSKQFCLTACCHGYIVHSLAEIRYFVALQQSSTAIPGLGLTEGLSRGRKEKMSE
jgi:hypothetical protein